MADPNQTGLPANPDIQTAFDQAFAPKAAAQPTAPAPAAAPAQSDPVNVINPAGKLVSIPPERLQEAINQGYKVATDAHVREYDLQERHGGIGQQAIAGLEAAGRGGTFGLSTALERAAGVKPEDIRGREEANPGTAAVGELAGLGLSVLIPGAGEANILKAAGQGAAKAAGIKGATFLSQVGEHAVRGAVEGALFQGGQEIHKAFSENPGLTAESAIADMGLAGVLGGVFGGVLGAASAGAKKLKPTFVSEVDRPKVEAGDFKATIEHSNVIPENEKVAILSDLGKEKADAKEIRAAAERLGAPVMEGMTAESKYIQRAEDALINGDPTYSGMKRHAMYKEGYDKATAAVDTAIGAESQFSKAQLGSELKNSISTEIKQQNAPIQAMYDRLKQTQEIIPVEKNSVNTLKSTLQDIKELRVAPNSSEGRMVRQVIDDIERSKTVDDLKAFRATIDVSPTASSGEKRMAGILRDKISQLEDEAIERYAYKTSVRQNSPWAENEFQTLKAQRKEASAQYKTFITKVQTLSEQLGKGRIYGVQDALRFIEDLTPEQVTQRLFSKNNSEFLKFFAKEFPQQFELMRQYQKTALREAASLKGEFSPKVFFNQVNKLEPEIQSALFTKPELQTVRDAETYIRSMPENFNPSGTATKQSFLESFKHPVATAIANARDLAIEKFIQLASASPEVSNATALAKATIKGWNQTTKAANEVFKSVKTALPANVVSITAHRDKLNKLVKEYTADPNKLFDIGANNPVAEYNTAFAATSAVAVQYLASLKPKTDPQNPLDSKMPPSAEKLAAYNRALDIAQKPLIVVESVKNGSVTPQDIISLKTMYPNLYNQLSQKLQENLIETVHKGQNVPYTTRIGLSMFLGKPLDSTMTQASILAAQPQPAQPQQQGADGNSPKRSPAALSKLPATYQTPSQARQARDLKQ